MAKDMHSIRFMLEDAKELVAKQNYNAARDRLSSMLKFYNQDAELDGPALEIASGFASEGEELLEQILPKCTS